MTRAECLAQHPSNGTWRAITEMVAANRATFLPRYRLLLLSLITERAAAGARGDWPLFHDLTTESAMVSTVIAALRPKE